MKILVTSDGLETLDRAIDYIQLLPTASSITILLTIREQFPTDKAEEYIGDIKRDLPEGFKAPVEVRIETGNPNQVVVSEAERGGYDLVVLGLHQRRRLTQLRPKSMAKHLASRLRAPLLVVSPAWHSLDRILIWTSGEEPDEMVIRRAGQLAESIKAEVTVLHVMSQIPLTADADTRDLERDADSLMEHQTHEGRHFEKAISILTEVGISPDKIEVKVRHGLTLDEIIEESEEGDFDLIVAGSTQIPEDESWNELRELMQDNTAIDILMKAERPVLIMRPQEVEQDFGIPARA